MYVHKESLHNACYVT